MSHIGRFTVEGASELGRGSFGQVFLGVDERGAPVAIKWIMPYPQPPVSGSQHILEAGMATDSKKLYREIHLLRRLNHPNIVKLIAVHSPVVRTRAEGEELQRILSLSAPSRTTAERGLLTSYVKNDIYLVFELLAGTNLKKLRGLDKVLDLAQVRHIAHQTCLGLEHMHSRGVMHRDLKTENIMVSFPPDGGVPMVKIVDLGMARVVEHTGTMPARSITGIVVTRTYRAPELLLGVGGKAGGEVIPYTNTIDVWSMGCVFAELLNMREGGSRAVFMAGTRLDPSGSGRKPQADAHKPRRGDQLGAIFDHLGFPSPEDLAWLGGDQESRDVVMKYRSLAPLFDPMVPEKLQSQFRDVDGDALSLLGSLLKFDPRQRCTIASALDHPFFSAHGFAHPPPAAGGAVFDAADEDSHEDTHEHVLSSITSELCEYL